MTINEQGRVVREPVPGEANRKVKVINPTSPIGADLRAPSFLM